MEKTERKWSARITDGRTIGRKCAFVVGLHNDSVYEDCIASIELNHKEDADGWFEKYFKIAECMNAHSELQAKAAAYDRLMSGEPKHCPFCHGEIKPIDHPPFWMAINGSQIDVYVDGLGAMATTINYCPMCGRRLTMPDGWEG